MIVKIDLEKCIEHGVEVEIACLLYEIHKTKKFTHAFYTPESFMVLEDEGYLLSTNPYILSDKALDLIGVKGDVINPKEFINLFPNRVKADVGYRVLRPLKEDTLSYKKLENDYLEKVLTKQEHDEICKNAKVFVDNEMKKNNGFYIPTLTNIIAENKWEYWDGLFDSHSKTIDREYGESV